VAPKTITDPEHLRLELTRVRSQRYAFDDMEFSHDMRCLALPVFEKGGQVLGGIAISGPSSRFDLEKLEQLRTIATPFAAELSTNLGGFW
jgi:DNA-binding IclR family transcriptional regulator